MKKSLLTTGATGLVGSRFVKLFSNKYEIHNMDLTVGVDITDTKKIENFINQHPADIIIHYAAFTNINKAFKQTGNKDGVCYQVNVQGTQNIAEICQEKGIHLIHISTDFVFSGDKQESYKETDKRDPIEWYGQTKAWAEEKVEDILDSYTIARIGYPFRANPGEKPGIVTKIINGLKDDSLYPQFTDMTITPTYIDDMAKALDVMIQKKAQGIYHLHGSTSLSPYELAKKVAETFGYDSTKIKKGSLEKYLETTKRPYQKHLIMDNTKAKEELGVNLKDIDTALADLKSQLT